MKKKKLIILIPIILLIIIIILFLTISNKKNHTKEEKEKEIKFKIEDRTKKLESYQKYNNDFYEVNAWIKVQGTNIDVPVIGILQLTNSERTLDLDNYVWQGDIHKELVNKETLIGHNILNLSSHPAYGIEYYTGFEDLMGFIYYDFAKKNQYIQYTINGKNYVYKVFSVFFDDYTRMVNDQFKYDVPKKRFKTMIDRYKKESYYKYDVDVDEKDKIITLDTCTRFFGKEDNRTFTVHARLLREGEKMDNYKVKKTDNYKKIEKKLIEKGEEENEEI